MYIYILANQTNVTIYTGVTNDLIRRVYEHRTHADPRSFTARYDVTKLVYFEETPDIRAALEREKQIKSWSRKKKMIWSVPKTRAGPISSTVFWNDAKLLLFVIARSEATRQSALPDLFGTERRISTPVTSLTGSE